MNEFNLTAIATIQHGKALPVSLQPEHRLAQCEIADGFVLVHVG